MKHMPSMKHIPMSDTIFIYLSTVCEQTKEENTWIGKD